MIELRDINVSFSDRAVLQGFSADISLERNTAIRGDSGSGKTTLLRVLAGLQTPDSGIVRGLEGCAVSVVFQEDRLLPWSSALENVALVSDTRTACELLDRLGLSDAKDERPAQLSGGMKRRVAIARALAFPGEPLLLDEPFNGLDASAKAVAAQAILASGRPAVIVTHSAEEANLLGATSFIRL